MSSKLYEPACRGPHDGTVFSNRTHHSPPTFWSLMGMEVGGVMMSVGASDGGWLLFGTLRRTLPRQRSAKLVTSMELEIHAKQTSSLPTLHSHER